jgi:prohibitin 2
MVRSPTDDMTYRVSVGSLVKYGAIGLVSFIFLLWVWPFNSVPTGSRGVVTQFGRIVRIEQEGLVVLPPWQHLSLFSIRAEAATIDNAPGGTHDIQPVHTSLTVRYSITPDQVAKVFEKYSHDGDLSSYVQTATLESFKAVTARYDATDLIAKRQLVSNDIHDVLQSKLITYGAQVIAIDMRDFKFQDSYMNAINKKVEQEQLRLAAENEFLTVQSQQKQKVAVAEAEATALKAKADGDAYATLKNATADAEALKVKNNALQQSTQILELQRIQVEQTKAERWNGQLPVNMYANTPIPFLSPTQYELRK